MTVCGGSYEGDFEACDVWREGSRAARRDHRCCECREVISRGARYAYADSLVAGEGWSTYRRCTPCAGLAELLSTLTGICPHWGQLADACQEEGFSFSRYLRSRRETASPSNVLPLPRRAAGGRS